ncbi:TetR/AcrR family transcriptional regulator [Rufibacter sp. LB8]|uniref:TetR/AcrR family transcriptional regulator n=1 Tax=Rufibacter sp. LB8 TaxID=2777781 RepID=UPI00178C2705|nr:TetR/AcrR family transcriptional regulator [Rufibacter sp. LB8]
MTFKKTVLQEAQNLFRQEGLSQQTEASILSRVDISSATFNEFFPGGMEDLVMQVVEFDLETRQQDHDALFEGVDSPLERLLLVVQFGLEQLRASVPTVLQEIMEGYPKAWAVYWEGSNTYTNHLVHELLNDGVLKKELRHDINIQLVTKIMLEQLALVVNPAVFSPEHYNVAEVFRSVFLYYIRGLCTDEGMKQADRFFSNTK